MPLASNIYPIQQAFGTSLRDALDLSRHGVDDVEVNFIRLENAGINVVQVTLGLTIVANSVLTLYGIPRAILN